MITVPDLIGRLAQAEIRLVERVDELGKRSDEQMERLAESQAHTDRRLDALIDVVDRLIPRNGAQK